MVKCPKCNNDIEYLVAFNERVYHFSDDGHGQPYYDDTGCDDYDSNIVRYDCPDCGQTLFDCDFGRINMEDEALAFLQSGGE